MSGRDRLPWQSLLKGQECPSVRRSGIPDVTALVGLRLKLWACPPTAVSMVTSPDSC